MSDAKSQAPAAPEPPTVPDVRWSPSENALYVHPRDAADRWISQPASPRRAASWAVPNLPADAVRLVPAGAEGDTPTAPAAGDAWHEALRRLDALAGVYTGYARIEEIRSWVERGGDGAAEAVDALTGGLVPGDTGQARARGELAAALAADPSLTWDELIYRAFQIRVGASGPRASSDTVQAPESPTASMPTSGRCGSGEAETATGAGQARETGADWAARPRRFSPEDTLSVAERLGAAEPQETPALVDLRARIAAAFAGVDNFAGEPPTREQLDWAHIAACVALKIGQPSGDTGQASR